MADKFKSPELERSWVFKDDKEGHVLGRVGIRERCTR